MKATRTFSGALGSVALGLLAWLAAPGGASATTTIAGSPLTILVSDDMRFQVLDADVPGAGQFFPAACNGPADAGIFVRVDGTLYSPAFTTGCTTAADFRLTPYMPWVPVSVSGVSGVGTTIDPYVLVVTADAGTTGLRLQMTVTYVNGEPFFRHTLEFQNTSAGTVAFDAYVASDLYLADSDDGIPYYDAGSGSVGGLDCNGSGYSILHVPFTPADSHCARGWYDVWGEVKLGHLSNTVAAGCQDNGAGLEWQNRVLGVGETLTILSATSFGELPTTTCVAPPAAMEVWLPLDETAGNAAFDLAAGHDGTWGALSFGSPTPSGDATVDRSYLFDHSGVTVPNSPSLEFGTDVDLTLDAWIKITGTGDDFVMPIVGKAHTVTGGFTLLVARDGGGAWHLGFDTWHYFLFHTPDVVTDAAGIVPMNTWTHVAVTLDRDDPAGGIFYINGAPLLTNVFDPATLYHPSLTTVSPLLVGASESWLGGAFDIGFAGLIDEVEVFRRALPAAEIRKVHAAGSLGKCKEACYTPPLTLICEQTTIALELTVCNFTVADHDYSIAVEGRTGSGGGPGPGCGVDGPAPGDVSISPNPVHVPSRSCRTVSFSFPRPSGLTTAGLTACHIVTVTNLDTGNMFHCSGAIQARETPCPSAHHVDQPLPVLVPEIVPIDVRNPAAVDDTLNYWVTVSASHAGGAFPAIRLDGGAPGQIVTGSTVIPAGGMRTIPVNVEFLEHYPVQFFDLELVGESPDGGFKDELASTGLRSTAGAEILAVDVPAVPYVATSAEAAIGGIRPNPSASATTISFRLARRGAVDLAVFDVRGARVARLLNEERAAGDYSVRWDGAREDATPLPSGVYFVVLRVAGRIGDTSRFVLVR